VFDEEVEPEPLLVPLCLFDYSNPLPISDDGRHESFFGKLFGKDQTQSIKTQTNAEYQSKLARFQEYLEFAQSPQPSSYLYQDFVEYRLIFPNDFEVSQNVAENLLLSFGYASAPVSYEVIGSRDETVIQLAVSEQDCKSVYQQIKSHLPGCTIAETNNHLVDSWNLGGDEALVVDFGLSNEFFLPIGLPGKEVDILTTVIGALSDLGRKEAGIFQILFQKARQNWAEEIQNSLYIFEDTDFFENIRSLDHLTKSKLSHPVFACVLRIAAKSDYGARSMQIIRGIASALLPTVLPSSNELIPLSNDGYSNRDHISGLLDRQTFRSGMILNSQELSTLVHPPSRKVVSDKLARESETTKRAPRTALDHEFVIGTNSHQDTTEEVSLSKQQRTKHVHILGSSGSGKSTLLLSLIKQDLELGEGFCVLDPHGDLIDDVIPHVPDERLSDIILFDPSDSNFPIGFNILQANSELEKTLLSSDLVATFRRMSTSWGDVMDSVLANAVLAFVESTKGGTLFELRRFLVEKDFRDTFLETVGDPSVRYFWQQQFPHLVSKSQASILIRLDSLLRNKLIRNIICQKETKLDFRQIMDSRKVLLIKLSQGLIGEENSHLLGTLIVSKIYQTALSRQDSNDRPYFWLYLDEFQHFITPSMENILSGVRKYNLGLHLSHQEYRQMLSRSAEVASSVLSNCHTRICFRLGDSDSEKFAAGFSFFDEKALQNLGVGQAIARIERSDFDFNLTIEPTPKVDKNLAQNRLKAIRENTRENFAEAKETVEAELFADQVAPGDTKDSSNEKTPRKETTEHRHKRTQDTDLTNQTNRDNTPGGSGLLLEPPESSKEENTHRYLQNLIKRIGENQGLVATLEQQVFGGVGRIDAVLESDHMRIACEIAVTNTVEYEIQNIQKCLVAGFNKVAIVSNEKSHLARIRKQAETMIAGELLSNVYFLEPEHFHLFLEKLNAEAGTAALSGDNNDKVKGYSISLGFNKLNETEQKIREKAIAEILSRTR
jgi:hypothetical protein